ncbi:MAG: efflux RND transporter periplasmic adaptor subunit [Syntrophomonas sp.]|nr:efflux RND transporter periplasmic adaptor subunit [Syntrophomonas sp.]
MLELSELGKRKSIVTIFLLLVIVAAAGIYYGYFYQRQAVLADARGSLTTTGTIEAKTVMTSFKVAGKIHTLLVDEGSAVEKGQELAMLDSREIAAKLAQSRGAQELALGKVGQADAGVPLTSQTVEAKIKQAQATVDKAQVGVINAGQKYDRAKALHESQAISDSLFDEATNSYNGAQNDLQLANGALNEALAARLKVSAAQSEYNAALGASKQAAGAVEEAQAYLDNTHLTAPISGFITQKLLEEGEMLSAGTPVFEISDLKHTYVKIFIDEKKISRVQLNQGAEVSVDAFPRKVFNGKVVWINQAGQFAVEKALNEQYSHDIRSFEVKIDLPNDDLVLKTGMTATVKILEEK